MCRKPGVPGGGREEGDVVKRTGGERRGESMGEELEGGREGGGTGGGKGREEVTS